MDSFELNKMAGALLGTVFFVFSVGLMSDALFSKEAPEKPGYALMAAEGDAPASGEAAAAPAAVEPIAPLLAKADATAGEAVFKKCGACHSGEKGGANKVGPNLWGIIGHPIAGHEGFNYSSAIKEFAVGKTWNYQEISEFVTKPKAYIKGTAMGFAGLPKAEDRANLLAYLRTLSDSPVPLP